MEEEVRMRGISIRRKMIDESKTYGFRLMGLFLKPLILGQSYPSSEFIGALKRYHFKK
jgi:hypothetical protein